jgi:transcriptional regulator GlxA family with amidase domain
LGEDLSVASLARRANLSPRTFARRFLEETATTPHQWVARQRLLAAQSRLESSRDSIEQIADAVGFGSAMTLRLHFRRALRTTPTAYRGRFSRLRER